jgi:hypothetical protein
MASNRRWRGQFRCRGSRSESAVAQLFSLGSITHTMKYAITFLALSFLLMGCNRDAKLTKEIPGTWKHDGVSTGSSQDTYASTMTISRDGTFSYFRLWNEKPLTNTYAGTWQVKGGFMLLTLTNRSGPHPLPRNAVIKSKIIRLDDHEFVDEADGITNISSR